MTLNKPGHVRLLSRRDILNLGADDMKLAVEAVKLAFEALESGQCLQPPKTSLRFADSNLEAQAGVVNVLPSAILIDGQKYFGVKALGAMPSNLEQGVPRATGTLSLFDDEHKSPIAIMDGQVISAMRTGAVSAIAAEIFAQKSTKEIGCVGAGVNMYTQLLGVLSTLKQVETVKIYSRSNSKNILAKKLPTKFPEINFQAVDSSHEAVRTAELIITCVANASEPVVKAASVNRPGVTIFNIGCLENEPKLLQSMDLIISDNWQQSKHRGVQTHAVAFSQNLISDQDVTNLSDYLAGRLKGRQTASQKIFFGPTGMGIEDLAFGVLLYKKALLNNIGQDFELWDKQEWI